MAPPKTPELKWDRKLILDKDLWPTRPGELNVNITCQKYIINQISIQQLNIARVIKNVSNISGFLTKLCKQVHK